MRSELERLQYIEHQLLISTPQSGDEWRVQLLLDPDLRADAEAQRLIYRGLYVAGQRQLRRELTAIHQQLYPAPSSGWRAVTARLRELVGRWLLLRLPE